MSVDFSILKYPVVGDLQPLGTLAEVSARVENALGFGIAESGAIAGRDWQIDYSATVEDGVVPMVYCALRGRCARGTPQFLGDWPDALRAIASALDAAVLDLQAGVPLGPDDEDVPAPEQTDDFMIELVPRSGREGSMGDAAEIWRDLNRRFGITPLQPTLIGDSWQLRVVGATTGPLRRLELHLGWTSVSARTAVLKRCATINNGGWVALDPARGDCFPLDWFLE